MRDHDDTPYIVIEKDSSSGVTSFLLGALVGILFGEPLVAGPAWGRVRALINDHGEQIKEAGPSTPVQVLGFSKQPVAGDRVLGAEDEASAKQRQRARLGGRCRFRGRRRLCNAEFSDRKFDGAADGNAAEQRTGRRVESEVCCSAVSVDGLRNALARCRGRRDIEHVCDVGLGIEVKRSGIGRQSQRD